MPRRIPGDWWPGFIPDNAVIHEGAYIESSSTFRDFRSEHPAALELGEGSALYSGCHLDLGPRGRVTVGRCAILSGCLITADELVEIGNYAMIGWLVSIADTPIIARDIQSRRASLKEAALRAERRFTRTQPTRPVRIGNNTWIGFECCIYPGVSIGEGSIVGARSVVIESVPPYCIAAGNPARVVRRIEPQESPHA